MVKTIKTLQEKKAEKKAKLTSGNLIAALNKAVLEARQAPSLAGPLLHPRYWNLSQLTPIHERPHGRCMIPGFHAFYPKSKRKENQEGEPWLNSATDTSQFVLYVSVMTITLLKRFAIFVTDVM
jgi:hypothetical protein